MNALQAREQWDRAAPGWARWEPVVGRWTRRITEQMLDAAAVGTGSRVIDIASGAGDQSVAAARRVGPGGLVVATDISPAMIGFVEEQARAGGFGQMRAAVSSADDLRVEGAPFDAAICRLGLMLLPDRAAAVAAVSRVLRPGGRFAAVVVGPPEANPFLARPLGILRRHADAPPPPTDGPGIFALADTDRLAALLASAGFADVTVTSVDETLEMPSAADAVQMIQDAFGVYRAIIASQSEAVRDAAWAEVRSTLEAMESAEGLRSPARFHLVAGALPG
jgi:SAM-dependent methyltransferase